MTEYQDPGIESVRGYFLALLGSAIRRPGMFGGQNALDMYLDAVGFVHGLPQLLNDERASLRRRGLFFSNGIKGGFENYWGLGTEDMIASVYAEIARRYGWLSPDRWLTGDEYEQLAGQYQEWCGRDHVLSEVAGSFGPPSLFIGGSNVKYPKTLAYMTDAPDAPPLSFHLWNSRDSAEHPEPVLLAVRREGGPLAGSFTLTPAGQALRSRSAAPPAPGGTPGPRTAAPTS